MCRASDVLMMDILQGRNHEMGNEGLKPVEDLTFREAMAELDGIVGVLESNTLELEDSLASYERGRCPSSCASRSLGNGSAEGRCAHGPA